MTGFIDFVQNHTMHAAPILISGIFALAIIVERVRALYIVYPIQNEKRFFERIREAVMRGQLAEAVAICDRYPTKPVAQVMKSALLRSHQPEVLIENGLEIAVEDASQKIQKRTSFLGMIANVATLLGLLGTIGGLVTSFQAIGTAEASQKTALLSAGISEAMNATMLGLAVAIPCMIAFSFLMNRTNRLLSNIETSAVKSIDILRQRYFEGESRVITQPGMNRSLQSSTQSMSQNSRRSGL